MLRRFVTLISFGLVVGVNADQKKLDKIQKTLDDIMAKAGISIGGEFRSQYFSSEIDGDSVKSSDRRVETNEYTSVDFDIKARPNEAVSARVMFRMHQNWQNFFSDISNPIFTRWISIDGNPLGMFRFNVGDFKEKYSPLTLWAPEIEMMYEPEVFARMRKYAMDELFLGDNYRVLQGVNFGFDAEVEPIFDEFHFALTGARLMSSQTSPQANSNIPLAVQEAKITKYFTGTNLDLTFLKGIDLGGSLLLTFDNRKSFKGTSKDPVKDSIEADTMAQKTFVASFRPGFDIARTFSLPELLTFKVSAEFAVSVDDTVAYDSVGVNDEKEVIRDFIYPGNIKGSAIRIGGEFGIQPGSAFGFHINANLIANEKNFRNIMAQSPTFLGDRIMNVEADGYKKFYSPFDALYNQVFKFTPVNNTNGWQKAPYMKTSYTNSIFLQDSLAKITNAMDPSFQLVMPLGPATPNRVGLTSDIKVSLINNSIELRGILTKLNEMTADQIEELTLAKTEYSQVGGGAKIDFSKMISAIKYPLELSASMVLSNAKNNTEDLSWEINSGVTNLALYYQFWKRMSILGGLQLINNKANYLELNGQDIEALEVAQKMKHWSAGLEWKVSDGASVVGTFGQVIVDTDEKDWPSEFGRAPSGKDNDYKHKIVNLFLRVKF